MKFTKMHGCGNDYVYVDGAAEKIDYDKKPEIVRILSDRHTGIGGDGVIFINPCDTADFEMEMWNADGTRAEMCGNGVRCVGKFVYDKGLTDKTDLVIESMGAKKYLHLNVADGLVETVRVNMGEPILEAAQIPVISNKDRVVDEPIIIQGKEYRMTGVSMGNPHAVIYTDDVEAIDFIANDFGKACENHERFPKRINTEFVQIIDDSTVKMRVYERGTGETLACGTGCCAICVACVLNKKTKNDITVKVLGGELQISWAGEGEPVYMTGSATTVFEGEIDLQLMM